MGVAALLLAVAIAVEVAATALLPRTEGFTNPWWTLTVVTAYAVAIGLLAVIVQHIPVSVTYAIWSGAGTALVAVIGLVFLDERLTAVQAVSLAMIVLGVVGLNLAGSG